jgi:hypothetical protein
MDVDPVDPSSSALVPGLSSPEVLEPCLSGTYSTCPGNISRVVSRFNLVSSEGVVSNRAATDVRVSDALT